MWKCVLLLSTLVVLSRRVHSGFCGVQCPSPAGSIVPCNPDCISNHGGNNGTCDGLCNCICDVYDQNSVVDSSVQCRGDGSDVAASFIFNSICELDCQCDHGTANGTCNFETHACTCGPPSTSACPAYVTSGAIFQSIIKYLCGLLGTLGIPAAGMIG